MVKDLKCPSTNHLMNEFKVFYFYENFRSQALFWSILNIEAKFRYARKQNTREHPTHKRLQIGSKMLRVKDPANELGVKDILAIFWKLITIYIAFLPIPKYLSPRTQNRIFYPQHFWTHLKPYIGRMLSGILFFSISKFGFNI